MLPTTFPHRYLLPATTLRCCARVLFIHFEAFRFISRMFPEMSMPRATTTRHVDTLSSYILHTPAAATYAMLAAGITLPLLFVFACCYARPRALQRPGDGEHAKHDEREFAEKRLRAYPPSAALHGGHAAAMLMPAGQRYGRHPAKNRLF